MDFRQLSAPILAAPMAGGPSTPELVAAVSKAGGYAYLAAGYLSPDALRERVVSTRRISPDPFGVNIFVPSDLNESRQGPPVEEFRAALTPLADTLGVDVPRPRWDDTDWFAEKIDLLVEEAVDSVSFTFGAPSANVVQRLHEAGIAVAVTVTDAEEAALAIREGADVLCVQGAEAGGHRSTHAVEATPNEESVLDLLGALSAMTDLPLVAAGGISTAAETAAALAKGAVAVQAGTAFLLAEEAGTNPAHRAALTDLSLTETAVTRAFSGRPARGLRNAYIDEYHQLAPSVFPIVDQLTKPLRAAAVAQRDHQRVSLWAGQGWRRAQPGTAAQIVAALTP